MGYSGGMESPSGNDRIEALKNLRISARLLGEFEWSAVRVERGMGSRTAPTRSPSRPATAGMRRHGSPGYAWARSEARATQKRGTLFGYVARASNGSTRLGTVIQGSPSYRLTPHWSVNGFIGVIDGGAVVRGSFDGDSLTYGYIENVVSF